MGRNYATVSQIAALKRELTDAEVARANELIPLISSELRVNAAKCGKDLDDMLDNDEDLAQVAVSVMADVVMRELMTSTSQEPMTQYSQSALGYSVSGSFLVPGGGVFIKRSELARLGINRQKIGVIEPYAY